MTEIMSCKCKVKIDETVCIKKKAISSMMHLELIVIALEKHITKRKKVVIIFQRI